LSAGEDLYLRAVDLSRQLGYHRALVRGLHNLAAGVYMPRGQFELSLAACAEALHIARQHAVSALIWAPLFTTAWVYWLIGRRQQAAATLDDLQRILLPGSGAEGYYYCAVANLALDDGNLDGVPTLFARARSIAEVTGEPSVNVLVRLGLSRYHRAIDDAGTARTWADDALNLATRVEYCHLRGMALVERGRAAWQGGDRVAAEVDLRAAVEILSALQARFDLARAWFFLAALLHEQQSKQANATWRNAAKAILDGNYVFLLEQERALAFPLVAAYLNHPDAEVATLSAKLVTQLERVPPPPLHVLALGQFEVRQMNCLISESAWRQRRAGELFRLLLISPSHSLSRDEIIEALWANKPSSSIQSLFHQATSALRRVLEPELPDRFPSRYLRSEEGCVTLYLPPGSKVDFRTFERHIQKEEWEAALAIYRGDLFQSDQYADWAVAPRERLRRLYLRALLVVAHRHDQAGRHREALDLCRHILEIEPWQEDAVLIGMKACLAFKDRAGALRMYRELERTLREELGAAPQTELQKLYESLL
jgi:DNA-binding SARP family transcriptional activator